MFLKRMDPNGAYAAVIPRWFSALAKGERPVIFGHTELDVLYVTIRSRATLIKKNHSISQRNYLQIC